MSLWEQGQGKGFRKGQRPAALKSLNLRMESWPSTLKERMSLWRSSLNLLQERKPQSSVQDLCVWTM